MKHTLHNVCKEVANKYLYKYDPKWLVDPWSVMKLRNDVYQGDCDDFATTVLYKYLGFWKMFWRVILRGDVVLYRALTLRGEFHVICEIDGYWFDNITKKPVKSRDDFLEITGNVILYRYNRLNLVAKFIVGLFNR